MDEQPPTLTTPKKEHWLNSTVLGAGITSALGDIAHESTTTVLPGFLAALGLPSAPAILGLIEGLSDATSSFTKLGAGYYSDRIGHRKPVVLLGYALTAGAQALYALAFGWPLILFGRLLAWFGRGIRGPLRDAILAESITEQTRGRAFGFHRAADTLGAVIGPLLGAGLLSLLESHATGADATVPFRIVFWVSLIPGFLSVVSFAFLVHEQERPPNHALKFWTTVRQLPKSFRRYLLAVGVFGMGDFAPTLLILAATQLLTPEWGLVHAAQIAAALYLWRNVVYAAASFPIGALGDRIGHRPVLAAGYALGALSAALMMYAFLVDETNQIGIIIAAFTIAGLYIAIEDTLESAMTADLVPPEIRGIGYGTLGTVNGIGDFFASAATGLLWSSISASCAFGVAAVFMTFGTVLMWIGWRQNEERLTL